MKVGALSLVSGSLEVDTADEPARLEQSAAQTARLAARLLAQLAVVGKHPHTDGVPTAH
jgi:hypothetical protein